VDPATLLGLLADDDRLRVVAALALGASTLTEVAATAGLDARPAGKALARLTAGGLVEPVAGGRGRYRLAREQFGQAVRSMEQQAPAAPPVESGLGPEADRVLAVFLKDGKLSQIPTARAKRMVVLDYLAGQFELGRAFPEKEVNEILRAYHPDVAALRRYLVDEQFLNRREGFYWRTGGTVTV
jgi:hypothetical protein